MRATSRIPIASAIVALALGGPSAASAQSATVTVTTDSPTGSVNPGETIRITTTVSWIGQGGAGWSIQGAFAGLRGSTINTPPLHGTLGLAGGQVTSDFSSGGLVTLGIPAGGSLVGLDIAVTPPFFTGPFFVPPIWNHEGVVVHSFDWTAPTGPGAAGVHRFDFVTPALAPNFRVYAGWNTPTHIEVPTTFIGASVRVIPAQPVAVLLGVAAAFGQRRRRA